MDDMEYGQNHPRDGGNWNLWSRHILAELKRLDNDVRALKVASESDKLEILKAIEGIKGDVKLLRFQMAFIGSLSAIIVTGIINFFTKY